MHGRIAQGIGNALFEEIICDQLGNIQTATLAEYTHPTTREIPPIELHYIETPTDASGRHCGRQAREASGSVGKIAKRTCA